MRKMSRSTKCALSTLFSAIADFRLRPKGFSTTMRESRLRPSPERPSTTVGNRLGGIAR